MDEELEEIPQAQGPRMEQQMLRYLAISAVGEILLLAGLVLILLGLSAFITDLLKIKGSGEFGLGIVLVIAAFVFLSRTKAPSVQVKMQQKKPVKPPAMDSYR
jgi:formate hydrogenlyase subunit 3/multisubunit Na+/H+ antiporter MnhD subunit